MNPSSDVEVTFNFHLPGLKTLDEIVQDRIGDRLVKRSGLPIGPEIQLQALQFHAKLIRYIADPDRREIWLTRFGANAGELGTLHGDLVIAPRIRVLEGFQAL